jgi:hypothetical protein
VLGAAWAAAGRGRRAMRRVTVTTVARFMAHSLLVSSSHTLTYVDVLTQQFV